MMHLLRQFSRAIFTGDREWAWRRRTAIGSCTVFFAGILNSIFRDVDLAHSSMVMTNSVTGLLGVITAYFGLAVTDDHLKRKANAEEKKAETHDQPR